MRESRYFKIIYAPVQDGNAQVRGVAVDVIATTRCVDAERDKIALQEKARAAPAQHALQLPLTDQRRSVATGHRSFCPMSACQALMATIWRACFAHCQGRRPPRCRPQPAKGSRRIAGKRWQQASAAVSTRTVNTQTLLAAIQPRGWMTGPRG